jgi:hypothetical protein
MVLVGPTSKTMVAAEAAAARPSSQKRRLLRASKKRMIVMRTEAGPARSSKMRWMPCVLTEAHLCTPRTGNLSSGSAKSMQRSR